MTQTITNGPLSLVCEDPIEVWRAQTAFTKEPGTIAWLDGLREGDVFYDVGANVGVYTLLAADRVGPRGMVYAFEPHLMNAAALLRNANGRKNIRVLPMALGGREGVIGFNYRSLRSGSSGSQAGNFKNEDGSIFAPEAQSISFVTTLSNIGPILYHADFIKIDVDGNEYQILLGLAEVRVWPRSIQVEVHPADRAGIVDLMTNSYGYRLDHVHYTSNGQKAIDRGADPETVVNNTVFVHVR